MRTLNFSFRRLWMLMRWDFGVNGKVYFLRISGLFIAFLLVLVCNSYRWDGGVVLRDGHTYEQCLFYAQYSVSRELVGSCLMIFFLAAIFQASRFMEGMSKKDGRICIFTLPVSNLEKFVYRAFLVTVCFILAGWAVFALADLVRYLILPLMDVNLEVQRVWLTDDFLRTSCVWLWGSDSFPPRSASWIIPWGYLIHVLFVLGRCHWRRMAGWRILAGVLLIMWGIPKLLLHFVPDNVTAIYAPAIGLKMVLWTLVILCWLLAYRSFCRSQVV